MSDKPSARFDGFFPGVAIIEAYGNGGFRFADMSHRGSLLALPGGVRAWPVETAQELTTQCFAAVVAERERLELLLLGTGAQQVFPSPEIQALFGGAELGLEVMSTGAAVRTYNVLLAEGRPVGAALIAVA